MTCAAQKRLCVRSLISFATEADFNQVEEYESDSDCSDVDSTADFDSEELVNGKPVMTRSGRQVQARIRFDVWKRFFKTVSHDIKVNRRTVIHTAWMLLQMFQQSGISLNLRTGPTGHATLFNQ